MPGKSATIIRKASFLHIGYVTYHFPQGSENELEKKQDATIEGEETAKTPTDEVTDSTAVTPATGQNVEQVTPETSTLPSMLMIIQYFTSLNFVPGTAPAPREELDKTIHLILNGLRNPENEPPTRSEFLKFIKEFIAQNRRLTYKLQYFLNNEEIQHLALAYIWESETCDFACTLSSELMNLNVRSPLWFSLLSRKHQFHVWMKITGMITIKRVCVRNGLSFFNWINCLDRNSFEQVVKQRNDLMIRCNWDGFTNFVEISVRHRVLSSLHETVKYLTETHEDITAKWTKHRNLHHDEVAQYKQLFKYCKMDIYAPDAYAFLTKDFSRSDPSASHQNRYERGQNFSNRHGNNERRNFERYDDRR